MRCFFRLRAANGSQDITIAKKPGCKNQKKIRNPANKTQRSHVYAPRHRKGRVSTLSANRNDPYEWWRLSSCRAGSTAAWKSGKCLLSISMSSMPNQMARASDGPAGLASAANSLRKENGVCRSSVHVYIAIRR